MIVPVRSGTAYRKSAREPERYGDVPRQHGNGVSTGRIIIVRDSEWHIPAPRKAFEACI
jgi:hypothetical protein